MLTATPTRSATSASITYSVHALQRLRERHDQHLRRYEDERSFRAAAYELFDQATFVNGHINDSVFMHKLHDKYGYDKKYRFKEHKNVLFVIVGDTITTVLDTDEHKTSRHHGRKKRF